MTIKTPNTPFGVARKNMVHVFYKDAKGKWAMMIGNASLYLSDEETDYMMRESIPGCRGKDGRWSYRKDIRTQICE